MATPFTLGGRTFASRLMLGTGKFSDVSVMLNAIKASGTELVTVALRRFNRDRREDDLLAPLAGLQGVTLVPNTSAPWMRKRR